MRAAAVPDSCMPTSRRRVPVTRSVGCWIIVALFLLPGWAALAQEGAPQEASTPQQQDEAAPPRRQRFSIFNAPKRDDARDDARSDAPVDQPSAQAATARRAGSPEEAAAYRQFMESTEPDETIRLSEDFLLAYPDSALKEFAYQAAAQAYQAKNDFPRMITYGELTLMENPDNITALLALASGLTESSGRNDPDLEENLTDAGQYASRLLEVLTRLPPPAGVSSEQWESTRKQMESTAHAAIGMAGLLREDFVRAESEYREAVALSPEPDAILFYRLGLVYSFQGQYRQAMDTLHRAADLGGVRLSGADGGERDLVSEALEFVEKSMVVEAPAPVPLGVEGAFEPPEPLVREIEAPPFLEPIDDEDGDSGGESGTYVE